VIADVQAGPSTVVIRHARMESPVGILRLFASSKGLVALTLPNDSREAAEARLRKRYAQAGIELSFVDGVDALSGPLTQLEEYFAGTRRTFDLELDHGGTPFQGAVWNELARIPYGETRRYADIARSIGRPTATRAVGAANGSNPLPIVLPCHRVIGSNGMLTGYGGGLPLKERLLAWERGGFKTW
jgi:methylated-DNA-[protein]-cysteine S-methyltransferase